MQSSVMDVTWCAKNHIDNCFVVSTNLAQTIDRFVNGVEEGDQVFGICCFVHVCLNDQFVGSAVAFDQSWEFVMDISCQMLQT